MRTCRVRAKVLSLIAQTNKILHEKGFLERARKEARFFTRERKMPFPKLMGCILGMIRESTQNALFRFFHALQSSTLMSQQAFSEARQKIRWEAFQELFGMTVNMTYHGYYETWQGYRVSAIDGSMLALPSDPALLEYYGGYGRGNTSPTAQGSILYDVYNRVVMDAQIAPRSIGEQRLTYKHIENLVQMESFSKELIIFDRAYASAKLIDTLHNSGIHFLFRVQRKFSRAIDEITQPDSLLPFAVNNARCVTLRVLKFALSSGEIETLITDLTDPCISTESFKPLYFKRWPVETQYDELKNKLEIENFSGRTVDAIKQDFFATMYMSNIAAAAYWEAQAEVVKARAGKNNKYQYQVNVNHEIGILKDHFIAALFAKNSRWRSLKVNYILACLAMRVTPSRPNRSLPRNPFPRRAKFHHNIKSNC